MFVRAMACAVAGLVALGVLEYRVLPRLIHGETRVAHATAVLAEIGDLQRSTEDASNRVSAALLAGAIGAEQAAQLPATERARDHAQHLQMLTAGDGPQQQSLSLLTLELDRHFLLLDQLMRTASRTAAGTRQALAQVEGSGSREAVRRIAAAMIDRERAAMAAVQASSEQNWSLVHTFTRCGLSVAIVSMLVSVLLLHRGVRKKQQIEQQLRKEQYLFATLLEHIPIGIFIKDRERRYTRASRCFATMSGVSEPSLMYGRMADDYFPVPAAEAARVRDLSVLQSGQPVLGEEMQTKNAWALTSLLPLYDTNNATIGLLGVAVDITARKQAELEQRDLAQRLASTVEHLELHHREDRILADMTELLQTCSSEDEAGEIIQRQLPALFPETSGHLSLTKASRNLVESVAGWGEHAGQALTFSPDQCWALRRGRPHRAGVQRAEPLCSGPCSNVGFHSYCVPMMAHGESIGAFKLLSRDAAFNQPQSELAATVAERAGLALANLRLRDALRVLSIRDPLTDLFNRRYLEESFERELRRATRHQRPLAVVMGDLDHFKRFNDSHGHEAGDTLLREFGALLRTHTRKEDIACRYGGEEFLLLLPELASASAHSCAEKIRTALSHLSISINGNPIGQVTASFGVAAYPEHGDAIDVLIRLADQALYRAKKAGRNQVAVAQRADIT